jgi:ectoine hydroxylase-related dioxygenase (phytanoyl-CoA dioxygenase family)
VAARILNDGIAQSLCRPQFAREGTPAMAIVIEKSYGVNDRLIAETEVDVAVELLRTLGYAVVDGGYSTTQLTEFSERFERAFKMAEKTAGGREVLEAIDEHNTLRVAFAYDRRLLELARNARILEITSRLIGEYHVLSQQNGVINPPGATNYNQGSWHRDLPYLHVVFSRPLAINALFCVDTFTSDNGATLVLPATHKQEAFPSRQFIKEAAIQVTAPRGAYIVLDCMTYHTGSANCTSVERRAINHVYTIPMLRQQIDLPAFLGDEFTSEPALRRLLGYDVSTPRSVAEYLQKRRQKLSK